jgi:hypothetical protein
LRWRTVDGRATGTRTRLGWSVSGRPERTGNLERSVREERVAHARGNFLGAMVSEGPDPPIGLPPQLREMMVLRREMNRLSLCRAKRKRCFKGYGGESPAPKICNRSGEQAQYRRFRQSKSIAWIGKGRATVDANLQPPNDQRLRSTIRACARRVMKACSSGRKNALLK